MSECLYESPPMKIGKHEWRMVVRNNSPTVSEYRFRGPKAPLDNYWCSQDSWPGYSYAKRNHGLPATLAKLYRAVESEVNAVLS